MRRALVRGLGISTAMVENYLPDNYKAIELRKEAGERSVLIEGEDRAGWTLDDYVLPRLASGNMFGEEVNDA